MNQSQAETHELLFKYFGNFMDKGNHKKVSSCNGYITHYWIQSYLKNRNPNHDIFAYKLYKKYRPFNFKMWQPQDVQIIQIWIQSYTQHVFHASQLHVSASQRGLFQVVQNYNRKSFT
jgi:hypothetical protein